VLTPAQIALGVEMLRNHRDLVVQDAEVVGAALSHYRKKPKLGFSDCMVLELARKAGHPPLGTFARGLSKLTGAELV
jgi:predicted nucleic-acid-binding protein